MKTTLFVCIMSVFGCITTTPPDTTPSRTLKAGGSFSPTTLFIYSDEPNNHQVGYIKKIDGSNKLLSSDGHITTVTDGWFICEIEGPGAADMCFGLSFIQGAEIVIRDNKVLIKMEIKEGAHCYEVFRARRVGPKNLVIEEPGITGSLYEISFEETDYMTTEGYGCSKKI